MTKNELRIKINQVKPLVSHLLEVNMSIYWRNFFLSSTLTWLSFIAIFYFYQLKGLYFEVLPLFIVCAISLYYSMSFTHELSHLDRQKYKIFFWIWNIMVGCPFAMPTFLYVDNHLIHHGKDYGTEHDAEYLNLKKHTLIRIGCFLSMTFILPILGFLRFLLLFPLSLVHPNIRQKVLENASFMGMRSSFKRKIPKNKKMKRRWFFQELLCFFYFAFFSSLLLTETIKPTSFFIWSSLITTVGLINGLKALACTHKYLSPGHAPLSWEDQILESIEIDKSNLMTFIFFPMSLQYHLTHHMFPSIPFHNLEEARRIISPHFPQESFYHQNVRSGLWNGLVSLLQACRKERESK